MQSITKPVVIMQSITKPVVIMQSITGGYLVMHCMITVGLASAQE